MSRENNDETINGNTIVVDLDSILPYTRVYRRFVRFKSVGDVQTFT